MPTGIYPRTRKADTRTDNVRAHNLRSEIVRLGVAERVKMLIAELRALARLYPVVMEIVPAAAALFAPDLTINANGHGPLPGRATLPLKAATSGTARERLSAKMQKAWEATRTAAEVNPKTGKPYTMSKRGRRAIARGRRAALKAAGQTTKASATAGTGAKPKRTMSAAQRKQLAVAARKRWKHARKLGRTNLGPVTAAGETTAETAAS